MQQLHVPVSSNTFSLSVTDCDKRVDGRHLSWLVLPYQVEKCGKHCTGEKYHLMCQSMGLFFKCKCIINSINKQCDCKSFCCFHPSVLECGLSISASDDISGCCTWFHLQKELVQRKSVFPEGYFYPK